ncbi:MAG: hypothetical protein HY461_03430 [Parcubacteria group bacterium]|nr:hypothetical protein [Parcubacteria group bacterium]
MGQGESSMTMLQVLSRVSALEKAVDKLQTNEKDIRTLIKEGFASMDEKFAWHDEQIDTLAIEINVIHKILGSIKLGQDKINVKLDRILDALALS